MSMRQFVSFVLAAVFLAATIPSQAQQRALASVWTSLKTLNLGRE